MNKGRRGRKIPVPCRVMAVAVPVLLFFCILFILALSMRKKDSTGGREYGMFEWTEESVDNPEKTDRLIRALSITRWYQEIPEELDRDKTVSFMEYMNRRKVKVYALTGSVEWGFEEDGASLSRQIQKVADYNDSVDEAYRFRGIMTDIEPYVSSRFREDPVYYMDLYVKGMRAAYEYAVSRNIRVIQCIPRHYDEQGLTAYLEQLIAYACDEVAVMNYGLSNEVEMIETEAGLCEKYEKELHCILEFQEVGIHGLTEQETYRQQGIKAADATWDKVEAAYPNIRIVRDYHWTLPLYDMIPDTDT